MKIIFSNRVKKDFLFTLTIIIPCAIIIYFIGMFIKNDYQLMNIEEVLRVPSIIEFIDLFVIGSIGLFYAALMFLFIAISIAILLFLVLETYSYLVSNIEIKKSKDNNKGLFNE